MPELFNRSETPPEDAGNGENLARDGEGRPVEGRTEPVASFNESRADINSRLAGRDALGNKVVRRPVSKTQKRIIAMTWVAMFFSLIYFLFIGLAAAAPGYSFADRVASIFLVFGSFFIFLHGIGYANSMIKASWAYDEVKKRVFSPMREPKVVCLIACFNEPLDVLEETISAMMAMDYGNKEVLILDDSTKEEIRQGVRELGAKHGARVIQRTNRRGYKAGAINDFLRLTDAPYVAVFDADGLPAHNLLRDLVPIIEENPRLAFVQTPQYYSNTDVSNVALAAARQQSVFYEYICEGKSYSRSAFCCGTNVIFRRDALLAVGGFDETSVTEDFMTSLNLHVKGYDSAYYNQVYAYSMAPETLGAYFTQQSRWAFGSVGGIHRVLKAMFTKPGSLSVGQWWEYFLSTTYYWIGWVNFTFMMLPMLYIFFNVKPLRADVFTYAGIFVPYIIFTMNMFYSGMEQRGYRVTDMLLGQQIGFLSFPIHMSAAISGIIGLKRPFAVTPKGASGRMGWLALWPQLLMMVLSAAAFLWGMWRYFGTGADRNDSAIVINSIWAFYHVVLLSGMFRLNQSLRANQPKKYFADDHGRLYREDDSRVKGMASEGAVATTSATGRITRPPIATPLRAGSTGITGRFALIFGILTLLLILLIGSSMASWALKSATPVNVYILDRTTGRDYQEHRALSWTLNHLKVQKQPEFHPASAKNSGRKYDWAQDFYGFIPGTAKDIRNRTGGQADLYAGGVNRLLPDTLQTPGVVYLADTYGEFVELDYGLNKFVKYQSEPRGVTPADVVKLQDFYNRDGLVIAEWNTIGYPTLPGDATSYAALDRTLRTAQAETEKGIQFLRTQELPARSRQLDQARRSGNSKWLAEMETQVTQTQQKITNLEDQLKQRRADIENRASYQEQLAAQQQLEKIVHVNYRGWYGRYVDKFEEEAEYDRRLFQNVNEFSDKKKFPNGPQGPGFVFYKDGPSQVRNPEKPNEWIENPFSKPVIITQEELGRSEIQYVSGIYRNNKPDVKNDPLLKGVAESVPTHYWFEMVEPMRGSTVLAWYKLAVNQTAFDRLRAAGFPANYLKTTKAGEGQIVFPAAIAYRENGKLRSFYFAGDASDYSLVSRISEMFPSTSGTMGFLGSRFGSYSQQFYWKYYEPLVKNVLTETPDIRYNANTKVASG
ncbi:MAG TPA: glycosyltransferase [Abditibacteriaceae bacterium]|jgi:cellulose synthase (UDP-forming)